MALWSLARALVTFFFYLPYQYLHFSKRRRCCHESRGLTYLGFLSLLKKCFLGLFLLVLFFREVIMCGNLLNSLLVDSV